MSIIVGGWETISFLWGKELVSFGKEIVLPYADKSGRLENDSLLVRGGIKSLFGAAFMRGRSEKAPALPPLQEGTRGGASLPALWRLSPL